MTTQERQRFEKFKRDLQGYPVKRMAFLANTVKDEDKDNICWKEYIENVMKKRGSAWLPLYRACKELN